MLANKFFLDQTYNFPNSAMNFMKNNPNLDYDQIYKKIGDLKAHARLTQKHPRNTQLNTNKQ